MENLPTSPSAETALDSFFENDWVLSNAEEKKAAYDTLTRILARQEGFDPDTMDLNGAFSSNKKYCNLEIINMNSATGEYHLQLVISNKFTEGSEKDTKSWKFDYHFQVSPEIFKKYLDKLSS